MSLQARIAYVMENGEPFCNHCETYFVPQNLTRIACTTCGCAQPNNDHGKTAVNFAGSDLSHTEGPTVADEAPNELVKEENGGVLDTSFVINWQKFKNSIILTNAEGTKKIQTRVFEVIDFGEGKTESE